ncbi:MAG: hypothetical protein JXR97_08225, partial [Planctomycetes bacterium]|nr:hypothetical protein [Planctomycetota bacterium]
MPRCLKFSPLGLIFAFILTIFLASQIHAGDVEGKELFPDGSFESGKIPDGWRIAKGVSIAKDGGMNCLRMEGGNST